MCRILPPEIDLHRIAVTKSFCVCSHVYSLRVWTQQRAIPYCRVFWRFSKATIGIPAGGTNGRPAGVELLIDPHEKNQRPKGTELNGTKIVLRRKKSILNLE